MDRRSSSLVRECWGPYGLERVGGFFPQDDGGGLIAIAPCVFRNETSMQAALASPETARVMADVNLVTAVKPQRSLATPCERRPLFAARQSYPRNRSASGLGPAFAVALVRDGVKVTAYSLHIDPLVTLVGEIEGAGVGVNNKVISDLSADEHTSLDICQWNSILGPGSVSSRKISRAFLHPIARTKSHGATQSASRSAEETLKFGA